MTKPRVGLRRRRHIVRLSITATLLLPLAIAASGCSESRSDASPAASDSPLRVSRGEFREVLHLTGEIEAAEGVTVTVPRLPNWQTTIKSIIADGTRVETGSILAELDSTPFSTGLEQKRDTREDAVQERAQQTSRGAADFAKLELDLEKARIELDKAKSKAAIPPEILPQREYEDNQLALRRAEVTREKARNDLESQRRASKADLANTQIKIDKAGSEIGTAEAAISSMSLRAPAAGVAIVSDPSCFPELLVTAGIRSQQGTATSPRPPH